MLIVTVCHVSAARHTPGGLATPAGCPVIKPTHCDRLCFTVNPID